MRSVDVAVVGAGPAGIAAALAASSTGADTLLIDENRDIGGQLLWRIGLTVDQAGIFDVDPGPGPTVAAQLASKLEQVPALSIETGTVAWGLFDDNVLGISTEFTADEIQARSIVVATGSTDIALPFPGWTLPGVMTARAAQIFMHVHRVLPGRTWVVLGDSIEADELTNDLERTGVKVVTRCPDVEQIRATGVNRLTHIEINDEVHEADSLAIALGRQPDVELAFHARAQGAFVPELGGYSAHRDDYGQTSEPGVYIAGDAAGIGTLPELVAEGHLVGLAAAGASETEKKNAREAFASVATEGRNRAMTRLRLAPAST
jgi:sarcosine oxidase, subunit alpha